MAHTLLKVALSGIRQLTPRIREYRLASLDGAPLPDYTPGAHVALHMGDAATGPLVRHYSLIGGSATQDDARHTYRIAVQHEDRNGGSAFIHASFDLGTRLQVSIPANHFPLDRRPGPCLLLAGGIGITPIFSMARSLARRRRDFTVVYAGRDVDLIYLLSGWLPTLMKDAGLPIERAANLTALFQLGGTVGALIVGFYMDRWTPNKVIALAYFGGALFVLLLALCGLQSSWLGVWILLAGFCMSGAQTGMNAFAAGCYPTASRATGVSWMLGVGRFGSIFGSTAGGVLLGFGWGFGAVVAVLALPAALAGITIVRGAIGPGARMPAEPAPAATAQ